MNRQQVQKLIFDVLNEELIKPNRGSDTMAYAIVEALGLTGDKHLMVFDDPEPARVNLIGFQIIHEMTADEMLEEALAFQHSQWKKASKNQLKQFVIEARMHNIKAAMIEEAQLESGGFMFGGGVDISE